jgi:hypothetical protein
MLLHADIALTSHIDGYDAADIGCGQEQRVVDVVFLTFDGWLIQRILFLDISFRDVGFDDEA